jgi:hypothetical protein
VNNNDRSEKALKCGFPMENNSSIKKNFLIVNPRKILFPKILFPKIPSIGRKITPGGEEPQKGFKRRFFL